MCVLHTCVLFSLLTEVLSMRVLLWKSSVVVFTTEGGNPPSGELLFTHQLGRYCLIMCSYVPSTWLLCWCT